MPTTTVHLPDDLKDRIVRAAEHAGMTSHALVLDAIAERVDAAERRHAFPDTAEQRYAEVLASGEMISWSEMRTCLEDLMAGEKSTPPAARKLSR